MRSSRAKPAQGWFARLQFAINAFDRVTKDVKQFLFKIDRGATAVVISSLDVTVISDAADSFEFCDGMSAAHTPRFVRFVRGCDAETIGD